MRPVGQALATTFESKPISSAVVVACIRASRSMAEEFNERRAWRARGPYDDERLQRPKSALEVRRHDLRLQLGSPRILYDIAGSTVAKQFGIDEFGIRQGTPSGPLELPFGFAGGLYEVDTQLTRLGARDYDARVGRWVSKDPILFGGGQSNLYVYADDDPINRVDLSRHYWWVVGTAAVTAGLDIL